MPKATPDDSKDEQKFTQVEIEVQDSINLPQPRIEKLKTTLASESALFKAIQDTDVSNQTITFLIPGSPTTVSLGTVKDASEDVLGVTCHVWVRRRFQDEITTKQQ